jgi:hypothetical protein
MRVLRANLDGSDNRNAFQPAATPIAGAREAGVSASRSMRAAVTSIGHRRGPDNAGQGRIFRAGIAIPRVKARRGGPTSVGGLQEQINLDLASRIIYWSTAETRRAAIRSTALRWMGIRKLLRNGRFCSPA